MRVNPHNQYLTSAPKHTQVSTGEVLVQEAGLYYRLLLTSGTAYALHSLKGETPSPSQGYTAYLLPPGGLCTLRALEGEVEVISIDFKAHPQLCNTQCPKRPKTRLRNTQAEPCDTIISPPTQIRPRRSKPQPTQIDLSPALGIWFEGLEHLLKLEDVALRYFDHKLEEFFLLLRLGYPQEVWQDFLRHYHCRIEGFRSRIINTYHIQMEVSDLYLLGEQMGLNEVAFKRSFNEEFMMPPREWLVEQRAKAVYRALVESDKPLKELSQIFGFCSVSHFGAFCRQTLGDTPLHIRKGMQEAKPLNV